MSKYNIDNGKIAVVDKIKHDEKHNQAKNLNTQLMTNDLSAQNNLQNVFRISVFGMWACFGSYTGH